MSAEKPTFDELIAGPDAPDPLDIARSKETAKADERKAMRLFKIQVIGMAAVLLLLAPGGSSVSADTDTSDIIEVPEGALQAFMAESACVPEFLGDMEFNDSIVQEEATACVELYENTEVAIVPFGVKSKDAEAIADEIETSFEEITDGKIQIDITVVEPDIATLDAYAEANDAEDCIEINDYNTYGSYIASEAMTKLDKYDKILALNAINACTPFIGGVASIFTNRHAEVFNVQDDWDALVANNGKQRYEHQYDSGFIFVSQLNSPVGIGNHELLHLFGVGHNGKIYGNYDVKSEWQSLNYSVMKAGKDNTPFKLDEYLSYASYSEYDSSNVMGHPDMDDNRELGIMNEYVLDWPNRVLGDEQSVRVSQLTMGTVEFNLNIGKPQVAVLELDTPLILGGNTELGKNSTEYTHEFTKLIFTPMHDGHDPFSGTYGVEVWVMDAGNNAASLGYITAPSEKDGYILSVNDQSVRIRIDDKSPAVYLSLSQN